MFGHLRMIISDNFEAMEFNRFMVESKEYARKHLMVSDGIMLDFLRKLPESVVSGIMVQRILTSYQLQKTLMETDSNPHFIALVSQIISSWESDILQSIYDIMKIKSYYHDCTIFFYVIGRESVFSQYMGRHFVIAGKREEKHTEGDLYSWEEQH
jgi:hypothetical protein